MHDTLIILDYGSQYTQLIARRLREAQVFCEIFHWQTPEAQTLALKPKGFILSGGPNSVYEENAPTLPDYVLKAGVPVLGICYGMQLLVHALGGKVAPGIQREYGSATVEIRQTTNLLPKDHTRYGCHTAIGWKHCRKDSGQPLRAMEVLLAAAEDETQRLYCLQFHPEVQHTPVGKQILKNFAVNICGVKADWTPESIVEESVSRIREQVGDRRVLGAVSGGVDSSVAAALVHKAIGKQLSAVFVDNGLLRAGERESVIEAMKTRLGDAFYFVDASRNFLDALKGIIDPEKKRLIVGETFIRAFEAKAKELGKMDFLMQGTIYPDVIESRAPERSAAHKIKSHHNVGGLPQEMDLKLVEPLRYLFKDEVRAVGTLLGLPDELVWRQPFPGQAWRCAVWAR